MNPWNIQSIYDLQYYNCPECIYKINSKQEFINHAYSFHPESEDYLRNIKDGSISDIDLPTDTKFGLKTKLNLLSYQSNDLDIKIEEFEDTKDDNLCFNINDKSLLNPIVIADPAEVDSYYCILCNIFYCNHDSLYEHRREVHEDDDNTKYDLKFEEDISIDDQVDKDFSPKEEDENAKRRRYQCGQCGKAYPFKCNLNMHIKTTHEGKRDYKCEECDKTYTKKNSLDRHIASIHQSVEYKCPQCEVTFTSKKLRRVHLKRYEGCCKNTYMTCSSHSIKE